VKQTRFRIREKRKQITTTEKDAASVLQWHDLAFKLRARLWSIGPGPTTVTSSVHSESSVHKEISPLGNITLIKGK